MRSFNEKWDDYLLKYIRAGGNSHFLFFAKSYHINKMDINSKYKTKAAQYYRQIIRSEVMSYDPPDNIALNDAKEVLDDIENVYEEFENYSSVKHVNLDLLEKNVKKVKDSLEDFGKVDTEN